MRSMKNKQINKQNDAENMQNDLQIDMLHAELLLLFESKNLGPKQMVT
jgi:hypothetical protein